MTPDKFTSDKILVYLAAFALGAVFVLAFIECARQVRERRRRR